MLQAAKRARSFASGESREDLEANDELLGFALVRAVEVVGEAASKITPETRQELAKIEWRNIIGMRNRVVHDYLNVDYDILWAVVIKNLPTCGKASKHKRCKSVAAEFDASCAGLGDSCALRRYLGPAQACAGA